MSDVTLLGLLRMPIPDDPDPITLRQIIGACRRAADRIEADALEIERLRGEIAQACRESALDRMAEDAQRVGLYD